MALTVETGDGNPSANTYILVADVDTYFTDRANTVWIGAAATKEAALIVATQYIDNHYHKRWKGRRANETQALDWPRLSVVDDDGYSILSTVIPQQLKDALAEAALRHITGILMADIDTPGTIKREKNKVGPLEEDITYSAASQTPRYVIIDNILNDLTLATGFVERA